MRSDSSSESEDPVARHAADVAVSVAEVYATAGKSSGREHHYTIKPRINSSKCATEPIHGTRNKLVCSGDENGVAQVTSKWSDWLQDHEKSHNFELEPCQKQVAGHLEKILAKTIRFEVRADSSALHHEPVAATNKNFGRLFKDVNPGCMGQVVNWDSELVQKQSECVQKANKCRVNKARNKISKKKLKDIVVQGGEVQAYATLAMRTARKHIRPVSKQENLGPRKISRQGWGGQVSPLEEIAKSLRLNGVQACM